jgi:nucleoid DNA-binding protein
VTKKEIVRDICDRANREKLMKGSLTQLATKEIVQWTFEAIIDTLVREGRIELRNFGVFEVRQRKSRKARNPRTGARVDVPPKNVVTFQPGKTMEKRVREEAKPVEPKKKPKKRMAMDEAKTSPAMTKTVEKPEAAQEAVGAAT